MHRGRLDRSVGFLVRLPERSHLLGERTRELELADNPLGDECLAEPLTRLALSHERLVELALRDEPALDEDIPETAPARRVFRPGGPTELCPLLCHDARELPPRDAESLDQDLTELLPGLALDLERDADLALGDEPALDEERADQAYRERLGGCHAPSIGSPSNEL